MSWFSRTQRFQIGDKVAFSPAFIARCNGDAKEKAQARGTVVRLIDDTTIARVDFSDGKPAQSIDVSHLVKVNGRER